jgi:hypothetical protein
MLVRYPSPDMASALPTPNDCCNCADGTAITATTLDAYILSKVRGYAPGFFAVSTLAALRDVATDSLNRYAIVFGATPSDLTQWKWNNSGTNADDGVNYVRPSDFTTAGVWAKASEEAIEIS